MELRRVDGVRRRTPHAYDLVDVIKFVPIIFIRIVISKKRLELRAAGDRQI
jgi:hypothetical protein